MSDPPPPPPHKDYLTKDRLDQVVEAVKVALSDPQLRSLSQRAVQAKIWHGQPTVASVLSELRTREEDVRTKLLSATSNLVYQFHEHAVDATLETAGLLSKHEDDDDDDAGGISFGRTCLDAKERLYMILNEYGWLQDFFRRYPLHFYENSFSFVHLIPPKEKLPVTVKVIGLGVAGSMAVSGLAKRGIAVTGYEKRPERGPRSATSRYQNASWRAYDTAACMLDEAAFDALASNRQVMHVPQQDGTVRVVSSDDRVQIILGSAIQAALDSARRYNPDCLVFECGSEYLQSSSSDGDDCDIVALFCGAHTVPSFPELSHVLPVHSWPELDSPCKMWLRVRPSVNTEAVTSRSGEVGAVHWHYTIESARNNVLELDRVQWNQESQRAALLAKQKAKQAQDGGGVGRGGSSKDDDDPQQAVYQAQKTQLQKVKEAVVQTNPGSRFDYIFTNAPTNTHNLLKKDAVKDDTVLEGGYTVEVKMATRATLSYSSSKSDCSSTSSENEALLALLTKLRTKHIVLGGDACVPPNPMAAYGATLACEAAFSLVLMATAMGHLNAILLNMERAIKEQAAHNEHVKELVEQVKELKALLFEHYEARAVSENYFQWVQTLICNMYSIPPFY